MAPAKNGTKTKKKQKATTKQHFKTRTISRAHALQCLLHVFAAFVQDALF
jgi:hypothetical protein